VYGPFIEENACDWLDALPSLERLFLAESFQFCHIYNPDQFAQLTHLHVQYESSRMHRAFGKDIINSNLYLPRLECLIVEAGKERQQICDTFAYRFPGLVEFLLRAGSIEVLFDAYLTHNTLQHLGVWTEDETSASFFDKVSLPRLKDLAVSIHSMSSLAQNGIPALVQRSGCRLGRLDVVIRDDQRREIEGRETDFVEKMGIPVVEYSAWYTQSNLFRESKIRWYTF